VKTARRSAWTREFKKVFPHARLLEPMKKHTTWGIGGPADAYLEVRDLEELQAACRFSYGHGVPLFLLGFGSNLLVLDGGIRGIVLRMKGEFDHIERRSDTRLWAGAAVRLPRLVLYCAQRGLAGAEPLVGVPGTVGGALVMNAGTREGEIGELVREVGVMDLDCRPRLLTGADLRFEYRHSSLEGKILTGAILELKAGDKVDIMARIRRLQERRLRTQPVHSRNVGSVFKNPPGRFAARLIEDVGLKGYQVGGAMVSPRHANFIENVRGASAQDVLELIDIIRSRVRERSGVDLELEVRVVGEA